MNSSENQIVGVTTPPVVSRAWTVQKVVNVARMRSARPDGQLVEVFAVIDDLANRADREARAFIRDLPENAPDFEPFIRPMAAAAHLDAAFIGSWMLLLRGTARSLLLGDLDGATHARRLTLLLVAAGRPSSPLAAGLISGSASSDLVDDFDLDPESLLDPTGGVRIAGAQWTRSERGEAWPGG